MLILITSLTCFHWPLFTSSLPLTLSSPPIQWLWKTSHRMWNKISVQKSKLICERTFQRKERTLALWSISPTLWTLAKKSFMICFSLGSVAKLHYFLKNKNQSNISIVLKYRAFLKELQRITRCFLIMLQRISETCWKFTCSCTCVPASFGYFACVYPYIRALFLTDTHTHAPQKCYLSTYLNRQVLVENKNVLTKAAAQRKGVSSIGNKGENMIWSNNLHIRNNC